jgi:hypothetical protein
MLQAQSGNFFVMCPEDVIRFFPGRRHVEAACPRVHTSATGILRGMERAF